MTSVAGVAGDTAAAARPGPTPGDGDDGSARRGPTPDHGGVRPGSAGDGGGVGWGSGGGGGGVRPGSGGDGGGARTGLTAMASVTADVDGGAPRIRWTQAWPVILRPTGRAQVHLVHGAGGPLGGDDLALEVRVGAAAALAVRSAGATLVQPGRDPGPARWDTTVDVGAGGELDWAPEPTVVTSGAAFETSLRVDLAAGARARVREVVVLGRHGQTGGRYRGRLTVTLDGAALLAHTTLLDGADRALGGPGGVAGARAVGSLLVTCGGGAGEGEWPGVRWAWTDLAGPARLLLAVGDPGPVIALLERTSHGQPGVGTAPTPGTPG